MLNRAQPLSIEEASTIRITIFDPIHLDDNSEIIAHFSRRALSSVSSTTPGEDLIAVDAPASIRRRYALEQSGYGKSSEAM